MSQLTSRAWYWAAAGMFFVGTSILVMSTLMMYSAATDLHRVVMPGKAELVLPPGLSTLYVESRSIVDGKAYLSSQELSYRCSLTDATGKAVPLETSTMKAKYAGGDYAGESALEARIRTAGTYTLACESSSDPFVIAVGAGVGAWTWVMIVGGGVPCGIATIMFVVVLLRRRRQKRARAAAVASGPRGS